MDGHHRAAGDLRLLQFRAVILNGSGLMAQNTVAGGRITGVLQNKPDTNQSCTVMVSGVSKMVAGAAISQGALVMSDSVGRAVAATSTNFVIGRAETAAAGSGEVISVSLDPLQPVL
jgi:hypothetical protein